MPTRRDFMLTSSAFSIGFSATGCVQINALDGSTVDLTPLSLAMDGRLLQARDVDFDQARKTFSFNPHTDRLPAAIARCATQRDVARCIEFGQLSGLQLAVRSGGHDVLAASTLNDGLVIDLTDLNSTTYNDESQTLTVGPGARAGRVDAAAVAAGRLVPLGCNTQVGVSGLTLGGGLGWFVGSHGATCDSLVRAKLITADGRTLEVSERKSPDLLWALRGGGGNFGVVTELEFRTYEALDTHGGYIAFDGNRLPEFLRFYRSFMADAPDALTAEVLVMAPAGRPIIFVMCCFLGTDEAASATFASLRAFGDPLADGLRRAAYPSVVTPTSEFGALFQGDSDAPQEERDAPGVQWLGGSIETLSDDAIEVIWNQVQQAKGGWAFNIGHYLHGVVCNPEQGSSPLPRPEGSFTYHFDAWWGSSANALRQMDWVDRSVDAMQPFEAPSYVNYLRTSDPQSVRASYGESFDRLLAVKELYDPDNVFRMNRNITT